MSSRAPRTKATVEPELVVEPEPITATYAGAHREVTVVVNGEPVRVARGETVEVSNEIALVVAELDGFTVAGPVVVPVEILETELVDETEPDTTDAVDPDADTTDKVAQ